MIKNQPEIAIIGMGCIFPKANGLKEYWRILFNGEDAITDVPENTHWAVNDYFDPDPSTPDHTYCRRGGFLPAVTFDPLEYGMPPNNLDATDTSQLLGLQVARMALEDAGYPPGHSDLTEKIVNIILGVTGTQELVIPLGARLGHPIWKKALEDSGIEGSKKDEIIQRLQGSYVDWQENSFPGLLGNVVAGRIANRLNLSGTNSVVDAACASSLSAIHTAVMELVSGKCDMSITGGVDSLNDIFMHMCFSKTGVLSHTSDARPFSADADGTVLGEGIGMLVLKRLEDAKKDQDRIYAVIKGVGTSSDGRTSGIYTPDAEGQKKALKKAYTEAGIDPATVGLVEAHGTGTRVGDKVEFTALKEYFNHSDRKNFCALGSVKSMIGHTKAAAGAAGIIKIAMSLYHKVIPPTLKAAKPDPELDINASPFYLNDSTKPWAGGTRNPRRSGVSAFGFGGSNFHMVLEEHHPEKSHVSWDGTFQIAAFSAGDSDGLIQKINTFKSEVTPEGICDSREKSQLIAWQTGLSRNAFSVKEPFRLLFIIKADDDPVHLSDLAVESVRKGNMMTGPVIFYQTGNQKGKLGYLFPGQGSQYINMGRDLISMFPEGLSVLDQAGKGFDSENHSTGRERLATSIFPPPKHLQDNKQSEEKLRQTDIAQPAIGTVSLAMIKILDRFGIRPHIACGHSFGELCALFLAGVIDEASFYTLAAARGKYMGRAGQISDDSGSMLAVKAPLTDIEKLIADENLDLILANRNSHDQGVLSGLSSEIDRAAKICRQKKMRAVKLPVAAAFHSKLVAHAADPFKKRLDTIPFSSPVIPVMSNSTGTAYPENGEQIREILGQQLISPVRFIENIQCMALNDVSTFVEMGPKTVLAGLVSSILNQEDITCVSLDASCGRKSGIEDLATVLCTIASKGFPVDLTQWEEAADKPASKKMRISLTGANVKPRNKCDLPVSRPEKGCCSPRTADHTISTRHQQETEITPPPEKGRTMTPPLSSTTDIDPYSSSAEAMKLVHKGFEAMQDLQAQTARAHEKFLETQAQASRTLQLMMENSRNLLARPVTGFSVPAAPSPTPSEPVVEALETDHPEVEKQMTEAVIAREKDSDANANQPDIADKAIQDTVFRIVSELTGFPVEMLELDMDIESDLGIDSIKKVEIVSELEKQVPSSEGLTTEHIGSVKTLKEICMAVTPRKGAVPDTKNRPPVKKEISAAGKAIPAVSGSSDMDMLKVLIETISELTGFPVEMIEPSMDLESDLGIDSIKRVEILSRLEQTLGSDVMLSSDDMAVLKTPGQIVSYLKQQQPSEAVQGIEPAVEAFEKKKPLEKPSSIDIQEDSKTILLRQIPEIKEYPTEQIRFYNGAKIDISPHHKVYITKESTGIAKAFKKAFKRKGISAELIDISSGKNRTLKDAAGIVIIPDPGNRKRSSSQFLADAFEMAHRNGNTLMASGTEKGAFFATVTFMGGTFGFSDHPVSGDPVYGGLAGLAKTAALEWKTVLCRALDLPDDADACIRQAEDCVSLMMTHGAVEMGLDGDFCNIPKLVPKEIIQREPELSRADVVVITGGAKGVTSECALEIARRFSPTIVLIGRSKEPSVEPEWLTGLKDEALIKKELLDRTFKHQKIRPADLEKAYQEIISNRMITQTLERIKREGSDVKYICADIRDEDLICRVFENIRDEYQNITAVIHAAGVLEDKLIVEKNPDQFIRVFDTKVKGLMSLVRATKADSLKYFVMFSSIAARTGNMGQSDYAMANEVLNKMAQKMAFNHVECRVLSINWGPWDGGMVDASLGREFARKGIELIPLKKGAEQLIMEMGNAGRGSVEVVIGASLVSDKKIKQPSFFSSFQQPVGRNASPVLKSHIINRQPVVPFSLLMEFMAHASLKSNPGLIFSGMDDMRLLKGVIAGEREIVLDVKTSKCRPGMGGYHVDCQVSCESEPERVLTHAACKTVLTDSRAKAPKKSSAVSMDLKPYPMSVEAAYEDVLFHGGDLQGITSITGFSARGIEVVTHCAPDPSKWLSSAHRTQWVIDPLMVDAAFQAAILWCHARTGQVCLPAYLANLKLYSSYSDPTDHVRISMTVNEETSHKIKGYFTFMNDNNDIIASINGFEAISDPSLIEKFKPGVLFSKKQILAFAQGNPSEAFGEKYRMFDTDREIARLPKPPYFFMDRVVKADPVQWEMSSGGWIETQYDIPEDAWYFAANRTKSLPFCILLEIALQPCGWLAAYAGSALHGDQRLYFRNLGGKATFIKPLTHLSGTITVRSRITDVSQAGGMIIQEFDMVVLKEGEPFYSGHTHFGFFSGQALAKQVGIRNSRMHGFELTREEAGLSRSYSFKTEAPVTPEDETIGKNTGMPSKALRMIDSVDQMILDKGGLFNKGFIRAVKMIDPNEWFFEAHFYQDPVCPGSLGIESFLQMIRFYALEKWQLDPEEWLFEMAPGHSHEWIYRGQIVPASRRVELTAHIRETDDKSWSIRADGSLSVDGICIYEMTEFAVQMIPVRQKTPGGHMENALKN